MSNRTGRKTISKAYYLESPEGFLATRWDGGSQPEVLRWDTYSEAAAEAEIKKAEHVSHSGEDWHIVKRVVERVPSGLLVERRLILEIRG